MLSGISCFTVHYVFIRPRHVCRSRLANSLLVLKKTVSQTKVCYFVCKVGKVSATCFTEILIEFSSLCLIDWQLSNNQWTAPQFVCYSSPICYVDHFYSSLPQVLTNNTTNTMRMFFCLKFKVGQQITMSCTLICKQDLILTD